MPNYRRYYVPGGTVFLTLVTHDRRALFSDPRNVQHLRDAVNEVQAEWPFEFVAAVVLPDHMHFMWTLPIGDCNYSKRVGRMKVRFTKRAKLEELPQSDSRIRHRESSVWQRRFWEHSIRDEDDFKNHLDYIHFNPVRHGLITCPHLWEYSSFRRWVKLGEYASDWGCSCDGRIASVPRFDAIAARVGE